MNIKDYLTLSDAQLKRMEEVYAGYRRLFEDPENCSPMLIVNAPQEKKYTWEERLADPIAMLKGELDVLRSSLIMEDDRVPAVRVQFGTAQVAAAFGCELSVPTNSMPAASSHVLAESQDVYKLKKPPLDAGWYGRLKMFTEVYRENLPEGVHISHPDIQGPFNTAHLIRGNDIMLDFFDDPGALDTLLDIITDYMLDLVPYLKNMISSDKEWFFDWGAMWKGTARICNCSAHMISPELFRKHVLPRDIRLMEAIGGGRVHYCGSHGKVIDYFFENPYITGLDYDEKYHDLWRLSERAPKKLTLALSLEVRSKTFYRLVHGDWPKKRNVIVNLYTSSIKEGKEALKALKKSIPE